MKNKFIDFFNQNGEKKFEKFYYFLFIIFFLTLSNEIVKLISFTKIFIIFIIFSFLYFFMKYKKATKSEKYFLDEKINFIKNNKNEIFYSSFLVLAKIFLLALFFPTLSVLLKYSFFTFFGIYIILKFFGFKIDYNFGKIKNSKFKIKFLRLEFIQIFIILISFLVIIFYKDIENNFLKKIKNEKIVNKKVEKKFKKNKEDYLNGETWEEKFKKLEDEVNARNNFNLDEKDIDEIYEDFTKKEEEIKKDKKIKNFYSFNNDLYPWTKNKEGEIKKLQKILEKLGYFNSEKNGKYDKKMLKSVKKLLIKKCGWPDTTKGYFGQQARKCINNLSIPLESSLPKKR